MVRRITNPKPLLRRSPLLPGESLASLLARLIRLNSYDAPYTLRLLVLPELEGRLNYKQENWDNLSRPFRQRTYERMSTLTKLSPLELYLATEHRFASVITPPDVHMETIPLRNVEGGFETLDLGSGRVTHWHLHTDSAAQYCPLCLREDKAPYHRLIWSVRAIAACRQHQVLLVRGCPECGSPVRVYDVVAATCRRCGADLKLAATVSVAGDTTGLVAQEVVQTWLYSEPPTEAIRHCLLPAQPHRVLYRVMQGFASAVARANPCWDFIHQVPGHTAGIELKSNKLTSANTEQAYHLYATAMKALMNWPEGFYTMLSSYRERRRDTKRRFEHSLLTDLGALYTGWLSRIWIGEEFSFVQNAFDAYLLSHQTSSPRISGVVRSKVSTRAGRFEYMTFPEAFAALEITRWNLENLIEAEYLSVHKVRQSNRRTFTLVNRQQVLSMLSQWETMGWLTPSQVSKLLKLSVKSLAPLRSAGLLNAESGPDVDGYPIYLYSEESVLACIQTLAVCEVQPNLAKADNLVPLCRALSLLSHRRFSSAQVLSLIANGQLQAYRVPKLPGTAPCLYLLRSDLEAIRKREDTEQSGCDALTLDLARGAQPGVQVL